MSLTVKQAFSMILLIILLAVLLVFVVSQQLLTKDQAEELSRLLGKEVLTTDKTEDLTVSYKASGGTYEYDIIIEDIRFNYKKLDEEDKVQIYPIISFRDKVAIAKDGGNYTYINYPKEGHKESIDKLKFNISTDKMPDPSGNELVHLMLWKKSQCIDDFFDSEGDRFNDLLSRCADNYISSVDVVTGVSPRALYVSIDVADPELHEFQLVKKGYDDHGTCALWSGLGDYGDSVCNAHAISEGYDGGIYSTYGTAPGPCVWQCQYAGYNTGVYIGGPTYCCGCNGIIPITENYCVILTNEKDLFAIQQCALTTTAPGFVNFPCLYQFKTGPC